jgi:vacuolar-type H+-ATPase subunit E/Vma4
MVEKLIKKVVEDAEKKAEDIIKKAEKELQECYSAEKEKIDKEYEDKLQAEKSKVDKEEERKFSSFRMEKGKEVLALQNTFIDKVMEKIEERFNGYLNKNMKDMIIFLCKGIGEKDFVVRVPESAENLEIKDIKVEKDRNLKNGFVVSSGKWNLVFDWESVKTTMADRLREKIGGVFASTDGQKNRT